MYYTGDGGNGVLSKLRTDFVMWEKSEADSHLTHTQNKF